MRTLGRPLELVYAELEAAPATFRRVDNQLVLGVLQAFDQVIERLADILGRFPHRAGDLGEGHRMVNQQ